MLQEDAIIELNRFFKSKSYPYEITKIFFYRWAHHESQFDNYEIINDIDRLHTCNIVRIRVEMLFKALPCEYDIKYITENGTLIFQNFKLIFLDYSPEEDYKTAREALETDLIPIVTNDFCSVFKSLLKKRE